MRQGRYCIVCGTTDWSVAQFSLPACQERRAKWLSILKVDPCYINSRSRVCSKHFAKNQLIRDRLKANALPKPLTSLSQGASRSAKKDKSRSEGGIWQDKINLNGRCTFCLELLKSKPTPRSPHWTSTSLSHLWPYLQSNGPTTEDIYFGKLDNDYELVFSQVPPMCTSCLQNINILNTLHHELEEIKAKLREHEKLVYSAAGRIREVVENSVKSRKRHKLQEELTNSKLPTSCVLSTTRFLDSLSPDLCSSPVVVINLMPQVTQGESQEEPPEYILLNSVPDQHILETKSIVTNKAEDLTFGITPPLPAEKAIVTTAVVLSDPVNVKIELPEETETEDITNADPMHVSVKTELNLDNENEMGGLFSQTETVSGKISNDLMNNEKRVPTATSKPEKRRKKCDSDYDKRKDGIIGTHLSHTKSYPNHQISALPDDEQLIDVPLSSRSDSENTAMDTDALYHDPLGDT